MPQTRTATGAFTVPGAATIAAVVAVLMTLGPPVGRTDTLNDFTTPSGNIYCEFSTNGDDVPIVACEGGGPYAGPRPECAVHLAFGDRFYMAQGELPKADCHGDTIRSNQPFAPVLDYGQSRTSGEITCDSETTGLTCTDAGTGHFFTMSAESNTLG